MSCPSRAMKHEQDYSLHMIQLGYFVINNRDPIFESEIVPSFSRRTMLCKTGTPTCISRALRVLQCYQSHELPESPFIIEFQINRVSSVSSNMHRIRFSKKFVLIEGIQIMISVQTYYFSSTYHVETCNSTLEMRGEG